MCSIILQQNHRCHKFEGVSSWNADFRNVHPSSCPWTECSCLYHKPFQWSSQYIHPHQPRTPTFRFTTNIFWVQLLEQSVCITKEFRPKPSETISVKLIYMLRVLIGVSAWLQFIDWFTLDGARHFGEFFTSWMHPSFTAQAWGQTMSCGWAVCWW